MTEGQLGEEVLGEQTPGTEVDYDEQEGKSLDELAGEGHIATPVGIPEWFVKYQGKSVKEMLEDTPEGVTANYDPNTKVLIINPTLPTQEEIMKPVDFKTGIFGMRGDIELVKSKVDNWMIFPTFAYKGKIPEDADVPEIKANLELAYRHLEDSCMRLGKALQAYDGGKSCYPR